MANLLIYAFTGTTYNPTTTGSGVSGSAITFGAGTSYGINNEGFASDPVLSMSPTASTSVADAITNNSYYTFTLTPDTGKKIGLSALTLNVARGGASTPRGLCVRSSIDSYVADLYSATIGTAVPTWTGVNIDLTGASFQGLTAAITFRLYCWAPEGGYFVDNDDITLTGTVADASAINTVNGLAKASVKTKNGLAIASVKTWNGLA